MTPDNPVNHRVTEGTVLAVRAEQVWLRESDGAIHRMWAPDDAPEWLPRDEQVRLYLGPRDGPNGWFAESGRIGVNQRHLEGESIAFGPDQLRCAGRCGLDWIAPAPDELIERDERCLDCAGELRPS